MQPSIAIRAWLAAASFLLTGGAMAQTPGEEDGRKTEQSSRTAVLVQKILGKTATTADQKAKLDELTQQFEPRLRALRQRLDVLTPEQKQAQKHAFDTAKAAGKPAEEIQRAVDEAVQLTPQQKTRQAEAQKEMTALEKELREKVMSVLTPDQREHREPPKLRVLTVETKNLVIQYPAPDDPLVAQKRAEYFARVSRAEAARNSHYLQVEPAAARKCADFMQKVFDLYWEQFAFEGRDPFQGKKITFVADAKWGEGSTSSSHEIRLGLSKFEWGLAYPYDRIFFHEMAHTFQDAQLNVDRCYVYHVVSGIKEALAEHWTCRVACKLEADVPSMMKYVESWRTGADARWPEDTLRYFETRLNAPYDLDWGMHPRHKPGQPGGEYLLQQMLFRVVDQCGWEIWPAFFRLTKDTGNPAAKRLIQERKKSGLRGSANMRDPLAKQAFAEFVADLSRGGARDLRPMFRAWGFELDDQGGTAPGPRPDKDRETKGPNNDQSARPQLTPYQRFRWGNPDRHLAYPKTRQLSATESADLERIRLPAKCDYSNYVTFVYCQGGGGGCGACTAAAVLNILTKRERPYAPDCSYRFLQYFYDSSIEDPKAPHLNQLDVLQLIGCCPEGQLNTDYDPPQPVEPTMVQFREAKLLRIAGYSDLIAPVSTDMLKRLLVRFGPLCAFGDVPGSPKDGHVFALIGYDDGTQSFTILNSYGDRWGQNGTMPMPYASVDHPPSTQSTPRVGKIRYVIDDKMPATAFPYIARVDVEHRRSRHCLTVKIGVENQEPATVWNRPNKRMDSSRRLLIDVPLPEYAGRFWPPSARNPWYAEVSDDLPPGQGRASTVATIHHITLVYCRRDASGRWVPELYKSAAEVPVQRSGTVRVTVPEKTKGVPLPQETSGSR